MISGAVWIKVLGQHLETNEYAVIRRVWAWFRVNCRKKLSNKEVCTSDKCNWAPAASLNPFGPVKANLLCCFEILALGKRERETIDPMRPHRRKFWLETLFRFWNPDQREHFWMPGRPRSLRSSPTRSGELCSCQQTPQCADKVAPPAGLTTWIANVNDFPATIQRHHIFFCTRFFVQEF